MAAFRWDYLGNKDITFLFKIVKKGRKYNASVYVQNKKGEMQWVSVGEQSLLKFSPRLGFYAWNRHANTYGNGPTHEINVKFERVVVRQVD